MGEVHTLGGHTFEVIGESTVEHDLRFMGLVRLAGLDLPSMKEGETPAEFALRLLGEILASGHALSMLGCLLVPEGTASEDWTPDLERETAGFLGRLVQAEDKEKVNRLVISLLVDFFESGLGSSETFLTSLARQKTPQKQEQTATGTGGS